MEMVSIQFEDLSLKMVLKSNLLFWVSGGTFALYSLICRHSRVNAIPSQQVVHMNLSAYRLQVPKKHPKRAEWIKSAIESSPTAKMGLLMLALIGTCMVLSDSILTPCISEYSIVAVVSAVDGVKKFNPNISKDAVMMISVAILVFLFSIQRFGTGKVGYSFAPAMVIWFLTIGVIGLYNVVQHDSSVLKAFNPIYIFRYFSGNPKEAWISLGGVVLCLTGTEAMFADLGHFSVRAIQISYSGLVYPCIVFAYIGQAAYLSKFPSDAADAFYKATPNSVYWPMFVIAVLASIIASQAMISASFSIVKQSMALACFPRVRVVHTSNKKEGQIYIPEINLLLCLACIFVTAFFKESANMGNAYGIAVVGVMLVTSCMLILIMLMIWQTNLLLIALFAVIFVTPELAYFSSMMYKFKQGGYITLAFAAVLSFIMYVWHYVQAKRYAFEVEQKLSTNDLATISSNRGITRVPGVGLLFSELTHGVPPLFNHFLTNLPAIHSVLVFVSVKYLPVNKVPPEERFLFQRVGAKHLRMYRSIARYGYRDCRVGHEEFEKLMMEHLETFIRMENEAASMEDGEKAEEEVQFLKWSRNAGGIVYLLGHSEVKAREGSFIIKRWVVDDVYGFMRRNFRQGFMDLQIPNQNLLQLLKTIPSTASATLEELVLKDCTYLGEIKVSAPVLQFKSLTCVASAEEYSESLPINFGNLGELMLQMDFHHWAAMWPTPMASSKTRNDSIREGDSPEMAFPHLKTIKVNAPPKEISNARGDSTSELGGSEKPLDLLFGRLGTFRKASSDAEIIIREHSEGGDSLSPTHMEVFRKG
ncbi:hypothetical protein ACLOJK_041881 [Asimina triloba]